MFLLTTEKNGAIIWKNSEKAGKSMRNNRRKCGFTLIEMLIVVAVIAILIAIAIPTITTQMHKAKVTADMANVRSYYAELLADYLTTGEFDTSLNADLWLNEFRELPFKSGAKVKLNAGRCYVRKPTQQEIDSGTVSNYKIYYFCDKGDCQYVME